MERVVVKAEPQIGSSIMMVYNFTALRVSLESLKLGRSVSQGMLHSLS